MGAPHHPHYRGTRVHYSERCALLLLLLQISHMSKEGARSEEVPHTNIKLTNQFTSLLSENSVIQLLVDKLHSSIRFGYPNPGADGKTGFATVPTPSADIIRVCINCAIQSCHSIVYFGLMTRPVRTTYPLLNNDRSLFGTTYPLLPPKR